MAEKYFPFDAVEVAGELDRLYSAEDFARYFRQFIGNGVYPNPSNGLQVVVKNGMIVTVCAGNAFTEGYAYVLTENMDIAIDTANASYNRKDIIVARLNLVDRKFTVLYRPGTAASSPVAPSVVRTSDIYDLQLAEITVRAGTTSILTTDILDTRLDSALCGEVVAVVDTVDTTTLFQQYQAYLTQKISEWNSTKTQQATDWQAQMNTQQTAFETQSSEIDAWYEAVKADITLLQTFSFDNLAELSGCTRSTVFNAGGSISENIVKTADSLKVAARSTVFNANGSITVTTTAYDDDGTTVLKTATVTTTFNSDGSISEVIV